MNPLEDGPKRALTAVVVKVLRHHRDDRGMTLEPHASRCVRPGDVHELVSTDHTDTAAGTRIDRVGFLGFAEFTRGGVVDRGDEFWLGDALIGRVLGFDACHFPNHYNILVSTPKPVTGTGLDLRPETPVQFVQSPAQNP